MIRYLQDAVNASIEIKLFHLKRKGAPFNPDIFYRAILTGDGDDYNDQVSQWVHAGGVEIGMHEYGD